MRHPLAKPPTPWRGAMGNERAREESRRMTGTRTENGEKPVRVGGQILTLGLNLVAPIALYYGLRAAGVGIYPALIVGAVVPALGAVVKLIRRERLDFLGLYHDDHAAARRGCRAPDRQSALPAGQGWLAHRGERCLDAAQRAQPASA